MVKIVCNKVSLSYVRYSGYCYLSVEIYVACSVKFVFVLMIIITFNYKIKENVRLSISQLDFLYDYIVYVSYNYLICFVFVSF